MPFRIRDSELCFTDPSKAVEHNKAARPITLKRLVDLDEFAFSGDERFDTRGSREAKRDRKIGALCPPP